VEWPGRHRITGLERDVYDVATFSVWTWEYRGLVRAHRLLAFDRTQWMRDGDSVCVESLARQIGWRHAMPAPRDAIRAPISGAGRNRGAASGVQAGLAVEEVARLRRAGPHNCRASR